jgi:pimeloyl-ACP methyl ester carboxylesterase
MTVEIDVARPDGRTLHAYDASPGDVDRVAVVWQHGTPNIGAPPEPLFAQADRLGLRWVSYDRPGYGGSTPNPDRDVASAAADVAAVVDALGIERFAVLGHSGGGPHALACAALLADRVLAAVSISGLAPFDADGLDWFAGMGEASAAALRAATQGRAAKEAFEASGTDAPPDFIAADEEALGDDWAWVLDVVRPALAAGPAPAIDDDLAYVSPWGFDPAQVRAPALFVHGARDRMVPAAHGEWLSRRCRGAELRIAPGEGHVSVLRHSPAALSWLADHVAAG